jgi:DNA polymerase-3 subunit epsilon
MGMLANLSSKIKAFFGQHQGLPEAVANLALTECRWLAVDFEFSCMDPKTAKFMSAGWIEGTSMGIDLESGYYRLIRAKGDLAQSPIIHGLTPRDIARGFHAKELFEHIMQFADSHIWVLHNAQLDMVMLKQLSIRLGVPLPTIVCIDTMQLALYQLHKKMSVIPNAAATLGACRERFDLAPALAHNALSDAMATMELWLAQMHILDATGRTTLQQLKATGAIKVFARPVAQNAQ